MKSQRVCNLHAVDAEHEFMQEVLWMRTCMKLMGVECSNHVIVQQTAERRRQPSCTSQTAC